MNKSLLPLYELTEEQISIVVINRLFPILCKPEGIGRNELLMDIGKKVFHVWALEKYYKSKKEKTLNEESFNEFYKNLDIDVLNQGDLGDMLLNGFREIGLLFDFTLVHIDGTEKREMIIQPSSIGIKILSEYFDVIGFKLPMICEPNE